MPLLIVREMMLACFVHVVNNKQPKRLEKFRIVFTAINQTKKASLKVSQMNYFYLFLFTSMKVNSVVLKIKL